MTLIPDDQDDADLKECNDLVGLKNRKYSFIYMSDVSLQKCQQKFALCVLKTNLDSHFE